jgi:hypothetical protein
MEEAGPDPCDVLMLEFARNQSMEVYRSNDDEKNRIDDQFKRYKPVCSFYKLRDGFKFRFMNNAEHSKTLQPRYDCHNCNTSFTFGGRKRKHALSLSKAKKRKHEEEANEEEHFAGSTTASSSQTRKHKEENYAILGFYENESSLIQMQVNHLPLVGVESSVAKSKESANNI